MALNRMLYALSARLPCRIIADGGVPYLERYYLTTICGVRFYLHRFVGSDPDRGLHDHPWPWAASIVLSGSYIELKRTGLHQVKWMNLIGGDTFHRIIVEKPCWTLFFHRSKCVKPWGFLRGTENTQLAWIPHNFPNLGHSTPEPWWLQVPLGQFEPRRQPMNLNISPPGKL